MKLTQSTGLSSASHRPFSSIARLGRWRAAALLAALLAPAGLARADTIILKSGTGTLPVEGTIVSIDSSELVYVSASTDRQTHKQIDNVLQIKAASEPKLTAAEQAYADGKWSDAVTNYQAALNSTSADWVKNRAIVRLIDAAAKSGQFAPQVAAFIEMAKRDPANARAHMPATTSVKGDQIKAVIGDVERNANNPSLKKESSDLLKEFLANLYLATGDTDKAKAALGGAAPAAPAIAPGNQAIGVAAAPPAGGASPDLVLSRAKVALAAGQYQNVVNEIEANKAVFTEPTAQAEALYDLAKAKDALAGKDPAKLQDAAIAYMRVVAHFNGKGTAGTNVPAALLRVGAIEEDLKQTNEAVQIYQTLTGDAKLQGGVIAAEAAKRLAAIKAAR
jgi:hypothetical protein